MAREKKKSKNPHEYRGNIWYAIFFGIVGIIVGYLGIKFIREGQVISAIITFLGLIMAAVIGAIAQVKKKEFKKELLSCLIGLSIGVIVGGIFGYVSSIHKVSPPEVEEPSPEQPKKELRPSSKGTESPSHRNTKKSKVSKKYPDPNPDPNNDNKQRKSPDYSRVIIKVEDKPIIDIEVFEERHIEIEYRHGREFRVIIENKQ
jgi:hypothetical protein